MFRLQKSIRRPTRSGDRLDFRFSDLRALQVPEGWDKLVLSLISVETGKSIAKSGKAFVRSGSCRWGETLSHSSKSYDEGRLKLVVSSGSTKQNTLGEATIDLAEYAGSRVAAEIALPLKKCSNGTIVELKIECLTPSLKTSHGESKCSKYEEPCLDLSSESTQSISNGSASADTDVLPHSQGLTSGLSLKSDSEEETQSQTPSIQGCDPLDGSIPTEDFSAWNTSETEECISSIENDSPSNEKSLDFGVNFQNYVSSGGSSMNPVEIREDTGERIRTEAEKSEKCTSKLLIDEGNILLAKMDFEDEGNYIAGSLEDKEALLLQLQQLKDSEKRLQANIRLVEEALREKNRNNRENSDSPGYVECETFDVLEEKDGDGIDVNKEIKSLRDKVQELENDCDELTNENLELILKLNDLTKSRSRECESFGEGFLLILEQIQTTFRLLGKPTCNGYYGKMDISGGKLQGDMKPDKENSSCKDVLCLLQEMNKLLEIQDRCLDEKEMEMEVQMLVLNAVSGNVHEQWFVAQEENQLLKEETKALQSYAACSMQEAMKLQGLNSKLQMENLDLHAKYSELAAKLNDSMEYLSDSTDKTKTSVAEVFTHRTGELEKEVELLNAQLTDARKEKERISFEACSEVSLILADKAELQALLQESQARTKMAEEKLKLELQESELKVQELMIQVAASIRSHERLMVDHEGTVKLLANYKKSEEKLKKDVSELELRLSGISSCDATATARQKYNRTKSSLETELKDLRERYLEMSLKYAEVEAQREDLVMKLKDARGNKRWF